MGWNSVALTIAETQAREAARIVTRTLPSAGYSVFTIDQQAPVRSTGTTTDRHDDWCRRTRRTVALSKAAARPRR
jgi:hypothetical protein